MIGDSAEEAWAAHGEAVGEAGVEAYWEARARGIPPLEASQWALKRGRERAEKIPEPPLPHRWDLPDRREPAWLTPPLIVIGGIAIAEGIALVIAVLQKACA